MSENEKRGTKNEVKHHLRVQLFELDSFSLSLSESDFIFYIVYQIGNNKYVYFYAGGDSNLDLHHIDPKKRIQHQPKRTF